MFKNKKILKKIKAAILSAVIGLGALSVTASGSTEEVSAATTLDIERAISEVVGGDNQNNWHYSYAGGNYFNAILSKSTTKEEFHEIGLDCSAGTIAVVARAIANAGGNPSEYFSDLAGYLNKTNDLDGLMSHAKVEKVASTAAEYTGKMVGDIVVYGTAHMNVYTGNNQTFDFGSNGVRAETQKGRAAHTTWTNVATSTIGGQSISGVYRVIMSKDITVDLEKKSANEELTNNNDCYTLDGAVYGVYDTAAKAQAASGSNYNSPMGTITTANGGKGTVTIEDVDPNLNTVYVKELVASKGYNVDNVDTTVHTVNLSDNGSGKLTYGKVTSYEQPKNDPFAIKVTKKDWNDSPNRSLAGAKFELTFYPGNDYTNGKTENVRHWTYQTIKKADGTYTWEYSSLESFVGGDDLYYVTKTDGSKMYALPYGTLVIKEVGAPDGYTLKDSYTTTGGTNVGNSATVTNSNTIIARVDDDLTKLHDLSITVNQQPGNELIELEQANTGGFDVFKGETDDTSAFNSPESGVQFTAILDSVIGEGKAFATYKDAYDAIISQVELNSDGSVKERVNIKDANGNVVLSKEEYDIKVTGQNGWAYSDKLATGTYIIRQTSKSKNLVTIDWNDINGQATFTVDHNWADDEEATHFYATNTETHYYLRLVKQDADTGKTVSLTNTSFKIKMLKDKDGNDVSELTKDFTLAGTSEKMHIENGFVTLKVSGKKYNTFTTNAKNGDVVVAPNWSNDEDNEGTVTTPLKVAGGTYEVTEVLTADGYLELEEPITFEVSESTISETDENGDFIKEIVIENEQPTGELTVKKNVNKWEEADQTLIDYDKVYTQIQFTLYAAENIIDPADGAVLAAKGSVATDIYGNVVGAFYLNEDGTYDLKDLPMGKYYLKETKVPNGLLLDDTKYDVEFTQEDQKIEHKTYKVIFDDDAKTSDWTDEVKVTSVGKTLQNQPTSTSISKTDVTGEKELEGATLTITDSEGNVVKDASGNDLRWTSGEDEYLIEGLTSGETYTLTEEIAAPGYAKATSIDFTINPDGTVNKVHMIDKRVEVSKVDIGGEEVEGAKLVITDKETGEVVDSWTSGKETHYANNLEVGKTYILTEDTTPLGYVKATEIEFTVTDNGLDQKVTMVDYVIDVDKVGTDGNRLDGATLTVIDSEGNTVDTWVSGEQKVELTDEQKTKLKAGETVEWTTEEGATIMVVPVEESSEEVTPVESGVKDIEKADTSSKAEVPVENADSDKDKDSETAKSYVYTLVTTTAEGVVSYVNIDLDGKETSHRINGLVEGSEYTLKESATIKGYYYAEDKTFTADSSTTITMVDNKINYAIEKIDDAGTPVVGVTLKLYDVTTDENGAYLYVDENGEPLEVELPNGGVTTEEAMLLEGVLEAGHEYKLVEAEYPAGYYQATDVYFNVNTFGTEDVVTITMVDEVASVSVKKVDNKGQALAGAKLQIIEATKDEDGNIVPVMKEVTSDTEATKQDASADIDSEYTVDETTEDGVAAQATDDESAKEAVTDKPTDDTDSGYAVDDLAEKADESDSLDEAYTVELEPSVVYEFTSTSDAAGTDISKYVKGDGYYILREVETPFGYNTIEDMAFQVTGKSATAQSIVAVDTPKTLNVKVNKVDSTSNTSLAGATFQLFNKEGKVALGVDGKPCEATTDKNGVATFSVLYNGSLEGFYVKEKTAPKGYVKSSEKYTVKLTEEFNFAKAYELTVKNIPETPTGVAGPIALVGAGIAAAAGIGLTSKKLKKKEDSEEEAE